MEWSAEAIELLRALWAEGHSTAEIGRRMGVTKNAVVGKAHRLNLPARPSPIRREAEGTRPAATGNAAPTPRRAPIMREQAPIRRPEPVVVAPVAPPAAVVRPFPRLSTRSCCWPIGEPGQAGFTFCSDSATPGKPYCAAHAAVAYVKARDRREDAA